MFGRAILSVSTSPGMSAMCPLSINKAELCNAALSSRMINPSCCFNETYNSCAIYRIESQRSDDRMARLRKEGLTTSAQFADEI